MMKIRINFLSVLTGLIVSIGAIAQESNSVTNLMQSDDKLTIGGYGQIDYNQDLKTESMSNGNLDVHRMVMLFGYKFSEKTQFVTELEFEHVKEVYVEQAFIDHKLLPSLSFRAGLMLVPMGLTNLYHEPTAFFGVERPNLDSKIAPTTWREIGTGFAGFVSGISLKYELYIMNGFNGFDGSGKFRGSDGFRKGRQKGAESFMSSPTFAGRVSFYGVSGLNIAYSSYQGKSQSTLFDGLERNNPQSFSVADSSRVGIDMHGIDVRYKANGIYTKAQLYTVNISNTDQYNEFSGKDLGSRMFGYYLEIAYDVLSHTDSKQKLIPFIRYEKYNTHAATDGQLSINPAYNRNEIVTGINYYLSDKSVLKADIQLFGSEDHEGFSKRLNFGVGVWF